MLTDHAESISAAAYWELLVNLTKREVMGRYTQSIFGVGWAIAQPLATMAAFTFVFSPRRGTEAADFPFALHVSLPFPHSPPAGLVCGAFHPLHFGHRQLREVAERLIGGPVYYEMSIRNVDKPPLDFLSIERRRAQFRAVVDEILRHLVAARPEHEIHCREEKGPVGPLADHPRQPGMAVRKQRRLRVA